MERLSGQIKYALDFADIFGTSLSLLVTAIAVGVTLLGSVVAIVSKWRTPEGGDSTAPLLVQARIDEVQVALRDQKAIALTAGIASVLLLFGQIVIGGTLASQFVQENVNRNVAGGMGVLVLISSLVHQQFRPDLVRRGARRRIVRLGAVLREAEDAVFSLERKDKNAEDIVVVRRRVSDALTTIETSEVEEQAGERRISLPSTSQGAPAASSDNGPHVGQPTPATSGGAPPVSTPPAGTPFSNPPAAG